IHETVNPVGVSTYLALTFGTLLSSQGTDASFVLTLSGFPPGFPSVLAVLLSCVSDSIRLFSLLASHGEAVPIKRSDGLWIGPLPFGEPDITRNIRAELNRPL
ncbi:hypothetical protein ACFRKD_09295, partial [Streptomyces niveus]